MSLFGRKEKEEISRLRAAMTPEQQELADIHGQIEAGRKKLAQLEELLRVGTEAVAKKKAELEVLKTQIVETDEAILLQSYGMYTPRYTYSTSDEYKDKLKMVREKQKEMVKAGTAVTGAQNWTVNGSASQGKKMVKDMQKLLLRAFNAECDDAIEHVTFSNIEASEKKIRASAEAISKLGAMMGIAISSNYMKGKLVELYMVHEYRVKKQEEKEEAKEARARQREEAKAQKELEDARKKLEKEQTHYENNLSRLNAQIEAAPTMEARLELEAKKRELESRLHQIDQDIQQVDYRAANLRAGYVYIISNIGAFGENVYKIGMTRRLEPMERIDELGDASVPFNFDVHALIFSEDAPGLEAALHNAFADRKLNCVNHRREFFAVTLDEIKEVVRQNFDKTVEFVDVAPAEQYRESLRLRGLEK